ncbi:MAG: hypothetical protein GWP48_01110 [Actinobacteria bacterium]|nr:hypothetical protein [Actinomycetota bacterium]
MIRRLTITMLAVSLLAAACSSENSSDDVVPQPTVTASVDDVVSIDGDGVDDCGQGGAFPDDPDFREAICLALMASLRLMGTDVAINPEWGTRLTAAMMNYANRDEAMAELAAVLAEIQAAG